MEKVLLEEIDQLKETALLETRRFNELITDLEEERSELRALLKKKERDSDELHLEMYREQQDDRQTILSLRRKVEDLEIEITRL